MGDGAAQLWTAMVATSSRLVRSACAVRQGKARAAGPETSRDFPIGPAVAPPSGPWGRMAR